MSTQSVTSSFLEGGSGAPQQQKLGVRNSNKSEEIRLCEACGNPVPQEMRKGTRYCSYKCQHPQTRHAARDMEAELKRELRTVARNVAYRYLNRDRYIAFDGRYQGPLNKSITFVETIKKDKGYHPMPIDVHCPELSKGANNKTALDDHYWTKRQKPFPHTQAMPRHFNTYCAHCIEAVVDESSNKVRVTKGVYLPIEHECASLRVYNLQGTLIEVKAI